MTKRLIPILMAGLLLAATGCSTSYKARPTSFRAPESYANAIKVGQTTVAARAFVDSRQAEEAFGFDVRGAGFLPVQVAFDNQSPQTLSIIAGQTFLYDAEGNVWPVLDQQTAYQRATRYSQTKEIFKEGAYKGLWGATAGAVIGAAIGVITGSDVLAGAGKGAAVGAATGAVIGGVEGSGGASARTAIITDLNNKSLQNKAIPPKSLAHGFIFFPGEAKSARKLRLQIREGDGEQVFTVMLEL